MLQRRTFLSLVACSLAHVPSASAASPAERQVARRLELWARAAAGTRALVARYALTRTTSLLLEPLSVAGQLVVRAPDALLLRDDGQAGATTRLSRGRLEIRPNDPALPAPPLAPTPASTWLFDHMLALFVAPAAPADPTAALLEDARASIPRGPGQLLDLSPSREHPARRQIRDLVVHLDPNTGDVEQLDLLEAGGDRVVMTFSQRRRDVPDAELAALLDR